MKKFITILLLLAAAGYVFFQGWAQLELPPGSCGVLHSKTHGTDDRPLRDGEFRWVWYKLIPRNVSIQAYRLPNLAVPIEASGTLLSAGTYAMLAGIRADFSYEFGGTVFCSLKSEALPALTGQHNMAGQDDLDAWTRREQEEISSFVVRRLWFYAEQEAALEEARTNGTIQALEYDAAAAFPDWENWRITLKTLRVPDLALYADVKGLYADYREAQKKILEPEVLSAAGKNIGARLRFEELEQYGELLTRYPVLLQYLALEKGAALPGN